MVDDSRRRKGRKSSSLRGLMNNKNTTDVVNDEKNDDDFSENDNSQRRRGQSSSFRKTSSNSNTNRPRRRSTSLRVNNNAKTKNGSDKPRRKRSSSFTTDDSRTSSFTSFSNNTDDNDTKNGNGDNNDDDERTEMDFSFVSKVKRSNRRTGVLNKEGKCIYEFQQTEEKVTIFLPIPETPSSSASDDPETSTTFCTITEDSVQLGCITEGWPCAWYLNHFTGGPVELSNSYWKAEDEEIVITLFKEEQGTNWDVPLVDDRNDRHEEPIVPKFFRRSLSTRQVPKIFRKAAVPAATTNSSSGSSSSSSSESPEGGSRTSSKTPKTPRGDKKVLKREDNTSDTADPSDQKDKQPNTKSREDVREEMSSSNNNKVSADGTRSTEQSTTRQEPKEWIASLEKQLMDGKEAVGDIEKYTQKKVEKLNRRLKEKQNDLSKEREKVETLRARVKELETKSMKSNGSDDSEEGADVAVEDEISKALLTETMEKELQLEKLKMELESKQKIIDQQAGALREKEELIQSLEKQLEEQKMISQLYEDFAKPSNDAELQESLKDLEESRKKYKELYRETYVENKKYKKKIDQLEKEMVEQLSEWSQLEREIGRARAKVDRMEARSKNDMDMDWDDNLSSVNEYLDRLSKKLMAARSHLEVLHSKRVKLVPPI